MSLNVFIGRMEPEAAMLGAMDWGLSIVQAIVLDHKGKITVQSAEGEGTQFVAVLPLLHGQKSEEKK